MNRIVSTSTMGPKQRQYGASHASRIWTLQKGKFKDRRNGFTKAEIWRAERIEQLDRIRAKAMESLDKADEAFLCKRYELMTVVCT